MTQDEFDALRIRNVVWNRETGATYVIVGQAPGGMKLAARIVAIADPGRWELSHKAKPAAK